MSPKTLISWENHFFEFLICNDIWILDQLDGIEWIPLSWSRFRLFGPDFGKFGKSADTIGNRDHDHVSFTKSYVSLHKWLLFPVFLIKILSWTRKLFSKKYEIHDFLKTCFKNIRVDFFGSFWSKSVRS